MRTFLKITLIIGLLTNAMICPVFAQSSTSKQFDFKGVALGTSLDDFRKMHHPDVGNPDYKSKSSTVICTGDKVPTHKNSSLRAEDASSPLLVPFDPAMLRVDETEKKLGVKKCVWVNNSALDELLLPSSNLGVISLYGTITYSFSFIPTPKDHTLRFYKFNGSYSTVAYGIALEALTKKFGEPTAATTPTPGSKDEAIWSNKTQTIKIELLFNEIMQITLIDNDLMNIYEKAEFARKAAREAAIKNPI